MARMIRSDILPILEGLCDTALGFYIRDREERSEEVYRALQFAIDYLRMPQIKDWIPAKPNNMPCDYGEDLVFIQIEDGEGCYPRIAEQKNGKWYTLEIDEPLDEETYKVTAWMPLPAPYKESEGE